MRKSGRAGGNTVKKVKMIFFWFRSLSSTPGLRQAGLYAETPNIGIMA